jgi:hypothetical protein
MPICSKRIVWVDALSAPGPTEAFGENPPVMTAMAPSTMNVMIAPATIHLSVTFSTEPLFASLACETWSFPSPIVQCWGEGARAGVLA